MSADSQAADQSLTDVQASADHRQVAIDKVGVKNVVYPIRLRTPDGGEQHTVATVNMYVSLPHHQKGTHMSRFLEVLNEHAQEIDPTDVMAICHDIKQRLNAADAHLELEFDYFIKKPAPVTGNIGLMSYRVTFDCLANGEQDFVMGVKAPATLAVSRVPRSSATTGRTISDARSKRRSAPAASCCGLKTWWRCVSPPPAHRCIPCSNARMKST
jgi:GTP cyclohydrolase I